jgi:hypothetical protein
MDIDNFDKIINAKAQSLNEFYVGAIPKIPICRSTQLTKSHFADVAAELFEKKKFIPRTAPYKKDGEFVEPCQAKLDLFKKLPDNVLDEDIISMIEDDMQIDCNGEEPVLSVLEATFGWNEMGSIDRSTGVGPWLYYNDTREKN